MTDDQPTVDLGSAEAEIDWMSYGRDDHADPAEAVYELSYEAAKRLLQGHREHAPDQSEVDDVYDEFTDLVNMTPSEFRDWAAHDCSDEASVKPQAVRERVLHLLDTPKDDWGAREVRDANRVIFLLTHMRDIPPDDSSGDCPSDRDIALMNWGYRPDDVDL